MAGEPLLLLALLMPVAASLIVQPLSFFHRFRSQANLVSVLLSTLLLVVAWAKGGGGVVQLTLENMLVVGLNLRLDAAALFFGLLFGLTAGGVSLYAHRYMAAASARGRFFLFFQLTLMGCLGVVLAADLLTLFLFFELMTFASYVLVIHSETPQALRAGNTYLFLGVVGGLTLLMGVILLYSATGTTAFLPVGPTAETGLLAAAAICFLIGFGIKTGVVPLHIWMPLAYQVSPLPVNAVSSGIMIKVGAYGLLRVFVEILFPVGGSLDFGSFFGWLLLWLGLASMFTGAFIALRQSNMVRTLAYSSVSQIGYVLMGLGVALLPFGKPAYGIAGMLYHILNHTLFKGVLFLVAGVLFSYAGTLDYSRLGGVAKKLPFVSGVFVVAALGIMGIPGLNGYASKTFLHHGVAALYHYNPLWILWLAEKVFVVASALTVCYFTKMFFSVFWGAEGSATSTIQPRPLPLAMGLPLALGAAAVAVAGLVPGSVVGNLIGPAMTAMALPATVVDYAAAVTVWTWADLREIVITVALGLLFYGLVVRFKLDRLPLPNWLSIERLFYRPLAQGFLLFCMGPGVLLDRKVNQLYHGTGDFSYLVCRAVGRVDKSLDNLYTRAGSFSGEMCKVLGVMDRQLGNFYNWLGSVSRKTCIDLGHFDSGLDNLYASLGLNALRAVNKVSALEAAYLGKARFQPERPAKAAWWQKGLDSSNWHIANLNVESIIVAVALVVVVVIFVFFGR